MNNATAHTDHDVAIAIEHEAEAWARHFGVTDDAALEDRRMVLRANVAAGYVGGLREFLPPLETLAAPTYLIVQELAQYGSRDEWIGSASTVVDCARTERHAFAICRRLGRWSDGEASFRVFRAEPDGRFPRTQVAWPLRPALVEDADLPF